MWYPGLVSHPHHDVARRLLRSAFGGMLALRLRGGGPAMQRYAAALELSAIAVSLGDVHSLVYPMPKRDNLIRLSVGCEDEDDLVADHTARTSIGASTSIAISRATRYLPVMWRLVSSS